jgi:inner membrane protein
LSPLAQAFTDYGWWILGLALLVLEAVLPGVFLLFFGVAALVVGTNVLILGDTGWFGWQQQILAYVVLSTAAVLLGRRWYRARHGAGEPGGLNRRTDRLIGRRAVLTEAIGVGGNGRVAIEDGWWVAEGPELPTGATVRIVGARGSVLLVEPEKV